MTDPYATWDHYIKRGLVSDAPDGLPDRAIVPLVESLRAAGFITYQSCTGHFSQGDGTLWIDVGPQVGPWPDTTWFTRIQHVYHGPEGDYWEYWWESTDARNAMREIAESYGVFTGEQFLDQGAEARRQR